MSSQHIDIQMKRNFNNYQFSFLPYFNTTYVDTNNINTLYKFNKYLLTCQGAVLVKGLSFLLRTD